MAVKSLSILSVTSQINWGLSGGGCRSRDLLEGQETFPQTHKAHKAHSWWGFEGPSRCSPLPIRHTIREIGGTPTVEAAATTYSVQVTSSAPPKWEG
jgi:hypothetical protein